MALRYSGGRIGLRPSRVVGALVAGVFWAALAGPLSASTVVPLPVETLADYAGQVFVGTVESLGPYWAEDPRQIETEVTFTSTSYLKGRLPEALPRATLVIPGGTMGQTQMRLCCAPRFEVGDRWVLFVLPTYKTYPVVGLWQGAFRVVADEQGIERVYSGVRRPVTGIDPRGFVEVAGARRTAEHQQHLLEARGVRVRSTEGASEAATAITLHDFVTLLQPVLDASRDHGLAAPAGRRVPARYRAVSIRGVGVRPAFQRAGDGPVGVVRDDARPRELPPGPRPAQPNNTGPRP